MAPSSSDAPNLGPGGMGMKPLLLSIVLVVAAGCVNSPSVRDDAHPQVRIGMARSDVLRILGPPDYKWDTVRRDMLGMGEPPWWRTELAVGDKVATWQYNTSRGTDHIYFLKGSNNVGHTRFIRKGVFFQHITRPGTR